AEIINTVAFSADNRTVAASAGQRAYVWEAAKGTLLHSFETNGIALFTPDGRFYAVPDSQGSLKLWDVETGRPVRAFDTEEKDSAPLAFSTDSRFLAARSREK